MSGVMAVNLVNLESATLDYGTRPVLHDLSLGVAAGERIGVVGRNGAGKSTLMRILATLQEPGEGSVGRAKRSWRRSSGR